MSDTVAPRPKRGVLRRLAIIAAVLVPAGAVAVGTADIAGATVCRANGHVYVTSTSPRSFRFEDQPVNGGFDVVNSFTAGSAPAFTVGGNGLRPGTAPIWSVQSSTGATYTFAGRTTGSNCVANETSVRLPVSTQPGEVWQISATYLAGNSGRLVQSQQHYQTSFVAPPPPPPPVWCFYDPDAGSSFCY
jgi:hypothetical protein